MKLRSARLFAVVLCLLPFSRLAAQDVSVTDPVWFSSEPTPEELPHQRSKLRPDYPDEMRKTSELGYVIIRRFVDATGKSLSLNSVGTHVAFQRAVEAEFRDWEMSPAKRGGQPINANIWMAVIFNPKSASTKGPNATPRLLAVAPAISKERPGPAGMPPVVSMRIGLDATGAITNAVPEDKVKDSVAAAVQEALKAWRFAPARANGQAVAAEIVVPVLCQPRGAGDVAKRVPPKVIKREPTIYPIEMRRYGIEGEVRVDFEVDAQGKVLNPVASSSNNPAFDEPAIAAVKQWQFQPATRDGQPVKARMQVEVRFRMENRGQSAYHIEDRGDQSKLPPELRYDTPAKIHSVFVPVYPYTVRREGVRGTVKALIMIDPRGRVVEVNVKSADRPEFGLALAAALENFTFDPALKNGKPVPHILSFEQPFNESELPDQAGEDLLSVEKKHPERILSASVLDAPLKPVSRRAPRFPLDHGAFDRGEAVVEFLVDKEGHARLPRIVSATSNAFGYAAVQAVATWMFEPPLSGGKAVVVRVQVPIMFSVKGEKPTPTPTPPPEEN